MGAGSNETSKGVKQMLLGLRHGWDPPKAESRPVAVRLNWEADTTYFLAQKNGLSVRGLRRRHHTHLSTALTWGHVRICFEFQKTRVECFQGRSHIHRSVVAGVLAGLIVHVLTGKSFAKFVETIQSETLSFVVSYVDEAAFVVTWVVLWFWFKEGWRPFGWPRANINDSYPLRDDLVAFNKQVRICANRLRGMGVLRNLDVVNRDIHWQRLLKGLERHKIATPPAGAGADAWYNFLIDLDDGTSRGDVEECRRIGLKHSKIPVVSPSTDEDEV